MIPYYSTVPNTDGIFNRFVTVFAAVTPTPATQ